VDDGPQWFAEKRYGYGAGLPISWQGWLVTLTYIAIVAVIAFLFGDKPLVLLALVIPLSAALMVITSKTTRGGWRWRWGEEPRD
jgi:hypothetical protein